MPRFSGSQLFEIRKMIGIRQMQVTKATGLNDTQISQWERGYAFPRPDQHEKWESFIVSEAERRIKSWDALLIAFENKLEDSAIRFILSNA